MRIDASNVGKLEEAMVVVYTARGQRKIAHRSPDQPAFTTAPLGQDGPGSLTAVTLARWIAEDIPEATPVSDVEVLAWLPKPRLADTVGGHRVFSHLPEGWSDPEFFSYDPEAKRWSSTHRGWYADLDELEAALRDRNDPIDLGSVRVYREVAR